MENQLDKHVLVEKLASLLINTNQQSSYTDNKLLMEKQREEWPELWRILEDIMYVVYVEDKFIKPR